LFRLLAVFLRAREEIGYIQGMSQIAALLLWETNNEFQSFVALSSILSTSPLHGFFTFNEKTIQRTCQSVEQKLKKMSSELWHLLAANEIETKIYVVSWVMTLFTRSFQLDSILNVWDILLANNLSPAILEELCVAMMLARKNSLFACTNCSKMVKLILHAKLELVEEDWVLSYLRALPRTTS
jgi:hypothetical protein